jgi:hypothetical protein
MLAQELDDSVHTIVLSAAVHGTPVFFLRDETCANQPAQMKGERRSRHVEASLDVGDIEATRSGPNEESINVEPGQIAQFGQAARGDSTIHDAALFQMRNHYNYKTGYVGFMAEQKRPIPRSKRAVPWFAATYARRFKSRSSETKSSTKRIIAERHTGRQIIAIARYATKAIGKHEGTKPRGPSPPELFKQGRALGVMTGNTDGNEFGAAEAMRKDRSRFRHHRYRCCRRLPGECLQHGTRKEERADQRGDGVTWQRQNSHRAYATDRQRLAWLQSKRNFRATSTSRKHRCHHLVAIAARNAARAD